MQVCIYKSMNHQTADALNKNMNVTRYIYTAKIIVCTYFTTYVTTYIHKHISKIMLKLPSKDGLSTGSHLQSCIEGSYAARQKHWFGCRHHRRIICLPHTVTNCVQRMQQSSVQDTSANAYSGVVVLAHNRLRKTLGSWFATRIVFWWNCCIGKRIRGIGDLKKGTRYCISNGVITTTI